MGCNHSGMKVVPEEEEKERQPKVKKKSHSRERKKDRKNEQKKKDDKKSKKERKSKRSKSDETSIVRRKWEQFRMWISRGNRTMVHTINMDQSSDTIAATQSGCQEPENGSQGRSNVHSPLSVTNVTHNLYTTQSEPIPGRKLIRPKAAKGERPKVKPHPAFSLPGVILDKDDQKVTAPPSCFLRTTTLNTSNKQWSGKVKKERPKAAKGQRTVHKMSNTEPTEKEPTEKECLDVWMRRQLTKDRF